ncbi:hypothetical protein K440DRAFT_630406 [Wilcoxina mikolae CBS 423.85]|nr:hypothetical protein K440DRAFT_630406 [Wilcoxina mikolae CBS 423.85]
MNILLTVTPNSPNIGMKDRETVALFAYTVLVAIALGYTHRNIGETSQLLLYHIGPTSSSHDGAAMRPLLMVVLMAW